MQNIHGKLKEIENIKSEISKKEKDIMRYNYELLVLRHEIFQVLRVKDNMDDPLKISRQQKRINATYKEIQELQRNLSNLYNEIEDLKRPEKVLAQMDSKIPILMFPVHLETKFHARNEEGIPSELWIRIYPDQISEDTHEGQLTEEEWEASQQFWKHFNTQGANEEQQLNAWIKLVDTMNVQRAIFIYHQGPPPNDEAFRDLKESSWAQSVRSNVMPDYFNIRLYYEKNGKELWKEIQTAIIPDPLKIGINPSEDFEENNESADFEQLFLGSEANWQVNFEKAIEFGMGVKVDLRQLDFDPREGFTKVVAIGIKLTDETESGKYKGSQKINDLMAHHYYSYGLSFLTAGTPTNNTKDAKSGHSSREDNYEVSLALAKGQKKSEEEDGIRWSRALGLNSSQEQEIVQHIVNSSQDDYQVAMQFSKLLWPSTWGYYMSTMWKGMVSPEATEEIKQHYIKYVKGGGHYPSILVDDVPYGLLPVSSFSNWKTTSGDSNSLEALNKIIKSLSNLWIEASRDSKVIPKIEGIDEKETNEEALGKILVQILAMEASSREFHSRFFITYQLLLFAILLQEEDLMKDAFNSKIIAKLFDWLQLASYEITVWQNGDPTKQPGNVATILAATFDQVKGEVDFNLTKNIFERVAEIMQGIIEKEISVFENQTGIKLDLEDIDQKDIGWIFQIISWVGTIPIKANIWLEEELPGIEKFDKKLLKPYAELENDLPFKSLFGNMLRLSRMEILRNNENDIEGETMFRDALKAIENLDPERLERHFSETLDLATNRLDAWISSFPARRLDQIREERPKGVYIGAYGWVENLKPKSRDRKKEFIHAPSVSHGVTAAILRDSYLSKKEKDLSGEGEDLLFGVPVELTSERLEKAHRVLEGLRAGNPLGIMLGEKFEKGLQREYDLGLGSESNKINMTKHLAAFQKAFPIKTQILNGKDVKNATASHFKVVNGYDLINSIIPYGEGIFSPIKEDSNEKQIVEYLKMKQAEVFDATADLTLTESVHRTVTQQFERMKASKKVASGDGQIPDEYAISETPRTGHGFGHTVSILFDNVEAPVSDLGWPRTIRSKVSPDLNAWAAKIFGSADNIYFIAKFSNGDEEVFSLPTEQGLSPIDIIQMSAKGIVGEETEIKRWLKIYVESKRQALKIDNFILDRWDTLNEDHLALGEVLMIAQLLEKLFTSATYWKPKAFYLAHEVEEGNNELVQAYREGYEDLLVKIQEIKTTYKTFDYSKDEANSLLEAAQFDFFSELNSTSKIDEIRAKKLAEVEALCLSPEILFDKEQQDDPQRIGQTFNTLISAERIDLYEKAIDGLLAAAKKLLGSSFVLLPSFKPPNWKELALSFNNDKLVTFAEAAEPSIWFHKATCTHVNLEKLSKIWNYGSCLQDELPEDLLIGQLPYQEEDCWVALNWEEQLKIKAVMQDFEDQSYTEFTGDEMDISSQLDPDEIEVLKEEISGKQSLVNHCPLGNPFIKNEAVPITGLILDSWTEVIPNDQEETAVSFQFDQPNNEAPNVCLLAISPDIDQPNWEWDHLVNTIEETMELMKIRLVDFDAMKEVGKFLPAIFGELRYSSTNQEFSYAFENSNQTEEKPKTTAA